MLKLSSAALLGGLGSALVGLTEIGELELVGAKALAFVALFVAFFTLGIAAGRRLDAGVAP